MKSIMNINLSTFLDSKFLYSTIHKFINASKRYVIGEGKRKDTFTSCKPHVHNKQEPVDSLIVDCAIKIFSYLNGAELATCCLVSKEWNGFVKEDQNNTLWKAIISRELSFGKEKWGKYFGDIGIEPPLPENIYEILKSPCPVFPGKTVAKTHLLVLVPEKVNEIPLCINNLGELVKTPKKGNKTGYNYIWDPIVNKHGNSPANKSHWVLMTGNVLEGSRAKIYADQVKIVAMLAEKAKIDYQIPKTLEAAVCILTKYVDTGKRLFVDTGIRLFSREPSTLTRCQEEIYGHQIVVGSFSSDGLGVGYENEFFSSNIGVAALREF